MSDLNLQDNELIRLQLYLAKCGVASRRASEKVITDGRVTVNGELCDQLGTKVKLTDKVCVDGVEVTFEKNKQYVLLNKPAGYVCSSADEKGRLIAADLLKEKYSERLYNVGRLDMFSTGLIIFTNDGDFAVKLSHPSAQIEKEYIVETSTNINKEIIERFKSGIRINDVFYKCKDAEQLNARKVRIVLIEGKNREIRKVFEHFELGIKSLTRIRIGNIKINALQTGMFRDLSEDEISGLLKICAN